MASRNYILGFKLKNGRFPTEDEIAINSTLIKSHEDAYESINSIVLADIDKYDSIEEMIEQIRSVDDK